MLPPFSRGGIVRRQSSLWLPSGPHTAAGCAPAGCGASAMPPASARAASRAFPCLNLRLAREHADGTRKRLVRYGDPGHLVGYGPARGEAPVDDGRIGVEIAQEPESGNDQGVAVLVGVDCQQLDLQRVSALRSVDVDGSGHRVNEVEIEGRHVVGDRIEGEIRIQRVPGVDDDDVARIRVRHRGNCGVVAVHAVRIVGAVIALLAHNDGGRPPNVRRIGKRRQRQGGEYGPEGCVEQCSHVGSLPRRLRRAWAR